jgi:Protein of unknown function (DUF1236)
MNKRLMISVAAIALIAGAGLANAQGGMKGESGGAAMQQNAPSSGATTGREGTGSSPTQSTQSEEKGAAKSQRAQERVQENAPGAKSKGMSSENEPKGGAKDMKAEGREGRDTSKSAQGREGRDADKTAQGREGRDADKSAQGREGRDADKSAQGREGTSDRAPMTTGQAGGGAKLSTEQRTKITTVIREQHVQPVTHVDFDIRLGVRVPRSGVSFHPLPPDVVTIYPEWRGYEYFLVNNQIVVVNPRTLEIVDVIDV